MRGWIRKRLRRMDLADFAAKRAVLGRTAYRERTRRLCRNEAAQTVPKNFFNGLANVKKTGLRCQGSSSERLMRAEFKAKFFNLNSNAELRQAFAVVFCDACC